MAKVTGFLDTIQWYEQNAAKYAQDISGFASNELLTSFVEEVKKRGKVLDAGCAAGRDSRLLTIAGMKVTGVDLSAKLLAIAKEQNPKLEFVQANFLQLPFKDNTFDGVWSHASLVHLETVADVAAALSEFYRVLKKNGVVHIFVKQKLGKEKTSVVSDSLSKHDRFFQWFTKDEVRDLLETAGFTILHLDDNYPDVGNRSGVKWIRALAKR